MKYSAEELLARAIYSYVYLDVFSLPLISALTEALTRLSTCSAGMRVAPWVRQASYA